MIQRRNLLLGVAALAFVPLCTPVQAGNRTFTFNEIQDFWTLVKRTEYPTVAALEKAVTDRFGPLPIKFFGPDSRSNEVRGVEIREIIPYHNASRERLAGMGDMGYPDGALVDYRIYAGADHIQLSKRTGYFPILLHPPR